MGDNITYEKKELLNDLTRPHSQLVLIEGGEYFHILDKPLRQVQPHVALFTQPQFL